MARSPAARRTRSLDERIAALRALDAAAPASTGPLREALGSANGTLVGIAAKAIAEHRLHELVPELVTAFASLCGDEATKRDPSCRGKIAIARALVELEQWEPDVFVRGLGITQIEGFDPDDTAAAVRGLCGIAHARLLRPDAADILAELLADKWRTARLAAAQGIGDLGRADLTALLRFKLLQKPDDPDVESACLDSLLSIARDSSIEFIVRLLDGHDDRAELAALALGGTRDARALEPLLLYAQTVRGSRATAYLAIALLRLDAATATLLGRVRTSGRADALDAARALATFRDDPIALRDLKAAIASRAEAPLRRELEALL